MALASVFIYIVGRIFGTGLWNPVFFVAFPPTLFGFVTGFHLLATMPSQFINLVMYNFIVENDDFAIMNYIFVILFAGTLLIPFLMYLTLMKYPEKHKLRYLKEKNPISDTINSDKTIM